eukprot:10022970-Alexandrium_andersonii.AAC.1
MEPSRSRAARWSFSARARNMDDRGQSLSFRNQFLLQPESMGVLLMHGVAGTGTSFSGAATPPEDPLGASFRDLDLSRSKNAPVEHIHWSSRT